METFDIRDLTFHYPEQPEPALCGLSLTVGQGDFLVVCGPSGCGKSTLLRQLKTVLAPHGRRSGQILFAGTPLEGVSRREQSRRIGFVQQSPDNQIVTDKVWHELAFGLESLGCDTPTIRRRVAEMASFFGIQTWFHQDVSQLSGGQKQLLNLAAVMTMQPEVLILDEPTSQLDPIAASDFLAVLGRINRELGTTVILTEHRLEEAFPLATAVAVLDRGRLLCTGTPDAVGCRLREKGHGMFLAMPTPMRIWAAVGNDDRCPVTVREGRDWLQAFAARHPLEALPREDDVPPAGGAAVEAEGLWFRYGPALPDVVRGLDLTLHRGELLALLGGNGTGKTTTLKLLAGLLTPGRGSLSVRGRVGVLPQNPQTLFVKKTVWEDLEEGLESLYPQPDARQQAVGRAARLCRLEGLLDHHPYDLSGGEQQRAALAKVLLRQPDILLMDEPTKGLDAAFKESFADIVQKLLAQGVAILMVSHDVEFCARYAHRCALFFDGSIAAEGRPRDFFSGNSFYTTSANRMARSLLPRAVTPEDIICACGGTLPPKEMPDGETAPLPRPPVAEKTGKQPPLPRWRKGLAAISGGAALALFLRALRAADPMSMAVTPKLYGGLLACLFALAFAVSRRSPRPVTPPPQEKKKLAGRTYAAAVLILLLIPLTLLAGEAYFGGRKYYFIALLVLLECMLPFFMIFEQRRPRARELVVIAVLCAIGVAGRAAFFMLPQFKPVLALTIISGAALGGETGFLVGAMTMLTSNVLYGQGPWTPWQMFAMGIIGFLAGVLFQRGWLGRSRLSLCVFGALSAVLVYGGIMNTASALMWADSLNREILITYWVSGFPMDCIHGAATWLFLWFAALPMLEKLDRIKVKYGLVE